MGYKPHTPRVVKNKRRKLSAVYKSKSSHIDVCTSVLVLHQFMRIK